MHNITIAYNGYTITTDKNLMVRGDVHQWLSEEAYWCLGIPYETVMLLIDHSYCVGVIMDGKQVGFARLVTDYCTFGYLADVYVVEQHRGKGLSRKMLDLMLEQDWVKGIRRMMLSTIFAHGLYEKYGFTSCRHPDRLMEVLLSPDMYRTDNDTSPPDKGNIEGTVA